MRICLVRCPSPFLIDERVFPPLGLMAVGTALKIQGHDVTIHDDGNIPMDFDYYGFGPTTPEYPYAMESKKAIKENNPNARVVLGGPFATLNQKKCMEDGWDCVVCGDGEVVAKEAFEGDSDCIIADERSLDDYPMIDRTILNIKNYKYLLEGRPATTMMTSQGCPYRCSFCSKNYKSVRFRSVEKVKEEIGMLYSEFGYDALAFVEDMFILKKDRVEAICDYLKELGIIWRCLVRADFIVRYGIKFSQMMADSGCVSVGMGIESGSDRILETINKGETIDTIKNAIRMLQGQGIKVKGFFIVGLPGENPETLEETRMFLDEMNLDDVDIKIYQPYPGNPIWENKDSFDIKWGDVPLDKSFYKGRLGEYYGNVYTSSLTNDQIVKAWIEMETRYKCQRLSV